MARGVHDVDLHAAVVNGGVLREDRDAFLALEVRRVHHSLGHVLVRTEGARLPEHGVDQRRFSVIDVGDDCNVSEILAVGHQTLMLR